MGATTFELDTLLNRFVDGDDTVAANRLGVLLSDLFPGDEVANERVGDLARRGNARPPRQPAQLSRAAEIVKMTGMWFSARLLLASK
jgi:hypothetical protein